MNSASRSSSILILLLTCVGCGSHAEPPSSPIAKFGTGAAPEPDVVTSDDQDAKAATDLDPAETAASKRRGDAAVNTEEYDKAIAEYQNAIRLDPNHVEARKHLAVAYNNRGAERNAKGAFDEAIADFTEAILIDPKDALAYWNRGNARFNKHSEPEYDKAIEDYTKAIELSSNNAGFYESRSHAYAMNEDVDNAISDLSQVIRLQPKAAVIYANRGYFQVVNGEYEKATADYSEALRIAPRSAYIHHCLASLRASCVDANFRNGQEAVQHATKACELSKWKARSYVQGLAVAYAEAGEFEMALKYLDRADRMQPSKEVLGEEFRKRQDELRRLFDEGKPFHYQPTIK